MLILTSPDKTEIKVFVRDRTVTTRESYRMYWNITGRRVCCVEDALVDATLRYLPKNGWSLRFESDRTAHSAPHLPAKGATSEFLPPTKG